MWDFEWTHRRSTLFTTWSSGSFKTIPVGVTVALWTQTICSYWSTGSAIFESLDACSWKRVKSPDRVSMLIAEASVCGPGNGSSKDSFRIATIRAASLNRLLLMGYVCRKSSATSLGERYPFWASRWNWNLTSKENLGYSGPARRLFKVFTWAR